MAKVTNPLLSGDASGNFGKKMIFKRGGIVTKMFSPRNPNTIAQVNHRTAFRSYYMAALTQAQADLLYAAIIHQHNDLYSLLGHGHNHGDLSGLGDDDHAQYLNQARGDARYSGVAHGHKYNVPLIAHGLGAVAGAGATVYLFPNCIGLQTTVNDVWFPIGGTLKTFIMRTIGTQPATGTLEIKLMIAGVETALKITVPAGSATGTFTDNINTVVVSAGSRIRFNIVNNASANSAGINSITLGLTADVTN